MLTQNQKERLTQLIEKCEDRPLSQLIEKASVHWISGKVKPVRNKYGVELDNGEYSCCPSNEVCLIGSAMLGETTTCNPITEKFEGRLMSDCCKKFDISRQKLNKIMSIFDGEDEFISPDDSTGLIIKELYEILFL